MPKINPTTAARLLNVSPQYIRRGIICGRLPIGSAVQMSAKWTYNIVPERLAAYMGISVTELEERIND